ncbi:hypothetical protein EXIGLDRAFT_725026 [Exidia glandulosa HHB12029]|uniref:Uncharacterized protein n=1 Tax=Exidia glandulosa HHB12029 TaxID=1314781 RepID=A0A165E847_EXIGL|nr:hypothetical protein EXIGLDRAFT_725026 [Exidia glandulosa HHB12029]
MQYFGPAPLEVFSAQEQYMPPQGLSRYRALPTDAPTAQPAYPTIHHHHHPGMAMPSYQHPNQVPGHGLNCLRPVCNLSHSGPATPRRAHLIFLL